MNATDEAAAALLRRSTIDILRSVWTSRVKNPEQHGQNATPRLVDVVERNEALLRALVLDYATRVATEVKFVGPTEATPTKAGREVNLLDWQKEK